MTDQRLLAAFLAVLVLSSCTGTPPAANAPHLTVTCPDPAGRARLTAGSTYRDLAAARVDAVRGWTLCHDALRISQD